MFILGLWLGLVVDGLGCAGTVFQLGIHGWFDHESGDGWRAETLDERKRRVLTTDTGRSSKSLHLTFTS